MAPVHSSPPYLSLQALRPGEPWQRHVLLKGSGTVTLERWLARRMLLPGRCHNCASEAPRRRHPEAAFAALQLCEECHDGLEPDIWKRCVLTCTTQQRRVEGARLCVDVPLPLGLGPASPDAIGSPACLRPSPSNYSLSVLPPNAARAGCRKTPTTQGTR